MQNIWAKDPQNSKLVKSCSIWDEQIQTPALMNDLHTFNWINEQTYFVMLAEVLTQ